MRKIKQLQGQAMLGPIPRLSTLLFLLFFLFQQHLQAQISTQAEINDLVANCACTELPGDLIIIGVGDINDLTPLAPLTSVGGTLALFGFTSPISLNGLHNIESVGVNLALDNVPGVSDLSDLSSLTTVDGNLIISGLVDIQSLNGLESLTTIGGNLTIAGNGQLSDCCSIQDLLNAGGVGGEVTINGNATGCDSPTEIENATCGVDPDDDNDGVTVGQGDCDDSDPDIFPGNPEICDGKDNDCNNQTDEGVADQAFVGDVYFFQQSQVDAWPSCYTSITGNLGFGGSNITDLSPLGGVTLVDGDVNIALDGVSSLEGLGIETITGEFDIASNEMLVNLVGLESLTSVGELDIYSNPNMESLDGLEGLTSLGDLDIFSMPVLTNIDGLINLTYIDVGISVFSNDMLTNVDGFANLLALGDRLSMFNNSMLTECCGVYVLLGTPGALPGGSFVASSNGVGCQSEQIVIDLCETDEDDDGVSVLEGDCDDDDALNFPDNVEVCDGQDNNCDGNIDEGFDMDNDLIPDCSDPCPLAPATLTNFDETTCNCLPGYFPAMEGSVITACQPCPAGSYCPDGINQLLCPAGSFSNDEGQIACQACETGFISAIEGATTCVPCPAGYYNSETGQTECTPCEAGRFNPVVGATVCQSCPSGTFQPEIAATACYDCCENTSSPVGATTCDPGPWSDFSDCSNECGEGTTSRIRDVTLYDSGVVTCTVETETETCTNIDIEAPAFADNSGSTCPENLTLLCSDLVVPAEPTLAVTDNCDPNPTVTLSVSGTVNGPNDETIINTWQATDASGNFAICVQTITILDDEAPTALCQNTTVELDADGNASVSIMDIDNGSSDACDFILELNQTDFTCEDIGPNTVTLTAIDPTGNIGNCTAEVTVSSGLAGCYCESYGESTAYEWIDNITVNGGDYTSGDDGGYGDYTGTVIPLATGWNSLQLEPGFAGNNYREYWTVFIDYNQDGAFDVATETAYYGSSFYGINTSIVVPSDAPTGTTRMRVAMRYGTYAYPCDIFAEGEVEDYTVDISYCDNVTDAGEIGDSESLCETDDDPAEIVSLADASGGSGNIEYVWLMNTTTSTPPTAYNMNGWEEIAGATSPSYDPGPISETTWYLRCARQSGCIQYTGESNVVEKAYEAICPLEYCDSEGEDTGYEWIKKVIMGSIYNYSGNDNGYGDYTYLSTNMNCGQSKTITLKPGFSGSYYYEYWRVWVDWNQDGDFDDAGELEVQTSGYYTRYGNVSAPINAVHGDTRMRVSMSYDGYPSPCDVFEYGEVEDYTIHVNANGFVESDKSGATEYSEENNEDEVSQTIGTGLMDIYPNPATTHVFVNLSKFEGQAIELRITNALGQVVIHEQIAEVLDQRQSYDLSAFESGHYVVSVTSADGQRIAKGLVVRK